LTGALLLQEEWADHLQELIATGDIRPEAAERYPALQVIGLPGSIDNDLFGSDMTIGADSALHRITEAVDAIKSTAASHQRIFIVEVMGRNCGYLALMSALATGADWVFIPENPPESDQWEAELCSFLHKAREAGKRQSVIVLAEGARDRDNNPITSWQLKGILEDALQEEVRITVLGHVQRGGSPSAFDRNLGTVLGYVSVDTIEAAHRSDPAVMIGMRGNRIVRTPLKECLDMGKTLTGHIKDRNYRKALELRGGSFEESLSVFKTVSRIVPHKPSEGQRRHRLAVMNVGAPAAGMNIAVRTAVRIALDAGHEIYGVHQGFDGFVDGEIYPLDWDQVDEWTTMGGSMLGTNRKVPSGSDFYQIARNLEKLEIEGLLIIGGWMAYVASHSLVSERKNFPAFNLPIVCLPATIDNDLPGSEISIGADTALNNIVSALDKIKQSAVASRRCFVVEVMGRYCGYLATMSGLASGAERVYIPEEGITLKDLQKDLNDLITGFQHGKRLGLMIRNENTNPIYDTPFICALFEEEGGDLFEVRQAILGHLQQGGDPTPFDRVHATRLATRAIKFLMDEVDRASHQAVFIGMTEGKIRFTPVEDFLRLVDADLMRPKEQWWLTLRPVVKMLAQPGPSAKIEAA
ncbi:MAG: 6-phosphofructokinase, partial [Anaerolineales bacterium]|nr:6-phosphofructokinase [Anaerolineales bacterium]